MIVNVGDGGASTAEAVQYDNSTSGLTSDNVQGAVDELNESLETKLNKSWTKLGSKTGTSAMTLPSNFSELKITCKANNGSYWRAYSFYVIKSELSTNSEKWTEGFGYNPNHYLCELSLSSNSVALSTFLEASVELASNATITVYYR